MRKNGECKISKQGRSIYKRADILAYNQTDLAVNSCANAALLIFANTIW